MTQQLVSMGVGGSDHNRVLLDVVMTRRGGALCSAPLQSPPSHVAPNLVEPPPPATMPHFKFCFRPESKLSAAAAAAAIAAPPSSSTTSTTRPHGQDHLLYCMWSR